MSRLIIMLTTTMLLMGCVNKHIEQGTVFNDNSVWIIQEGDTRFAIESELGSPTILDASHPDRALYVEDYMDAETEKSYTRSIAIVYDEAWRVKSITRLGFE